MIDFNSWKKSIKQIEKLELKYFNINEFDSPDEKDSGKNCSVELLKKLDEARGVLGLPIKITSGYRTKKHNEYLGDKGYRISKNSSHLKGYAADILATDNAYRFKLLQALIEVGFVRIGIGGTFIHVDVDKNKIQNIIWTY